ncbi:MAG: NAD(P)/FAD-dependent oxidoreductase [Proteobacteria bacterium]|nr:NAD(P)/FAD-dependent oxidoreductase [Pseudomonadota bacterium]
MLKKIYDVIVVGAGPAGLNAARLLAGKGLEVLIIEAKEEVGKGVICTGIIGRETFEKFDVSHESIIKSIQKVKLISPLGTSIFYNHPFPFAYIVDREEFDNYLLEFAMKNGAEIKLKHRVINVSVEKDWVEIGCKHTEGELRTYRGKVLILATGIEYELNKKLGLGYPARFLKAAQKYSRCNSNEYVTLLLGNKIAKGGFGWIVPVGNDMARVGLMTEGNPKIGFKHIIEKYLQEEEYKDLQLKPIAQGIVSKTFRERVLAVGEAAGQVKTTTGGGVYFGLLCSEIASTTILEAFKDGNFSKKKFSTYEKQWKSKIAREIRTGYIVRNFCGRLSDHQMERVFNIIQSDGFFDYIAKNADFDWHGKFLLGFLKKISYFLNLSH